MNLSELTDFVIAASGLVVLPLLLRSSKALDARPRVGLMVWFGLGLLGWTGLLSLALRIALGSPQLSLLGAIAQFSADLTSGHPLRGLGMKEVLGLTIASDLAVLLIGGWIVAAWTIWRQRHGQRALLDLVSRYDASDPSLRLLLHDQPVAYFIPGSGGRVVISRGTQQVLGGDELAAVIAHEHGHGHGHHSSLLVPLQALSPFVWILPYARFAPSAIAAYVEMAADDHARRATSTSALRRALSKADALCLAPMGTIGWNSAYVERRLLRLDAQSTPLANAFIMTTCVSMAASIFWSLANVH